MPYRFLAVASTGQKSPAFTTQQQAEKWAAKAVRSCASAHVYCRHVGVRGHDNDIELVARFEALTAEELAGCR